MIGKILFGIAAILFFLGGIRSTAVSNPTDWGLFCMALGLVLRDSGLGFLKRR